jgi:hypothetical protein
VHAPGDHHVDDEAGVQTLGTSQLTVFNAAAAFEGTVERLNP